MTAADFATIREGLEFVRAQLSSQLHFKYHEPTAVAAELVDRSLAALARVEAENARLGEKLRDIATREWRDEGGRLAAAIARDGLALSGEQP